jgi:SPP1 gp7 family putative phage head morphogenesis protein
MMGKRWEEMRDTLASDLSNSNQIASSIINGYTPEVYATNHNYGTFEVEKGSMVDTSYTLYDRQTVEKLIKDNPSLLPQAKVNIPKDEQWNQKKVTSAITQSILQGESIKQTAKRLQTVTDMNKSASIRNARTMTTSAENAGRVDSYERAEKMGIKMKQVWLSTADGRTRRSHVELDGEMIEVGGVFSNGCRYPGDPRGDPSEVYNCRCTLIAQVDGVDLNASDLTSRNNKLGGMTYEEWKEEHTTTTDVPDFTQAGIGSAKSVDEVNQILNSSGYFTTKCDLTGCDLDSAKSIASSYERVTSVYPQVKGKIGGVTAKDLGDSTYAQCYLYGDKRVETNNKKDFYGNFAELVKSYDHDVATGWHPRGTTAESIIIHELGHAVDGLLTDVGALGAGGHFSPSGKYTYNTTSKYLRAKVAMSTGTKVADMGSAVSEYASCNEKEWFAECFAEYLTSASPRPVAKKFGEMLEELMNEL